MVLLAHPKVVQLTKEGQWFPFLALMKGSDKEDCVDDLICDCFRFRVKVIGS